jgi:6-pyruvoyltetrahydropterin/6-carboxytetrahydropterin synthase
MIELHVSEWIQVAHRLTKLPGKCQQIHGHSMHVTLSLVADVNADGYAIDDSEQVLDFSRVKQIFREYLNTRYDHHLLLNMDDPWADKLFFVDEDHPKQQSYLPGLTTCNGDPSTENIARWIYLEMMKKIGPEVRRVVIEETSTNGVSYP